MQYTPPTMVIRFNGEISADHQTLVILVQSNCTLKNDCSIISTHKKLIKFSECTCVKVFVGIHVCYACERQYVYVYVLCMCVCLQANHQLEDECR